MHSWISTMVLKFLNRVKAIQLNIMLKNTQKHDGNSNLRELDRLGTNYILHTLWQNSSWNITEVQTYRPSFASYFIIQLLLFGLHVLEKRIFAQVFIVSRRALEIYVFSHFGFCQTTDSRRNSHQLPLIQPGLRRLNQQNGDVLLYTMYSFFQQTHLTKNMLTRTLFPRYVFVNKCHGHSRWSSSSCFFFPGQGAQCVGMCKRLLTKKKVLQLFEDASKILGYDLLTLCLNGPLEELNKTVNCQPAIVVASLAALQDEKVKGTKVSFSHQKIMKWELQ